MFFGQFVHALDEKNRIVLPSKFRSQLTETVYVTLSFDRTLTICGEKAFALKSEKMMALDDFDKDQRHLKDYFFQNTFEAKMDKQGRIGLPSVFLSQCGIKKDVMLLGNGDTIRVQSKEGFEEEQGKNPVNLSLLAQQVRDKVHGQQ